MRATKYDMGGGHSSKLGFSQKKGGTEGKSSRPKRSEVERITAGGGQQRDETPTVGSCWVFFF